MAINGTGRACKDGWINAFIEHTANLESAEIFRRWAGIATIAAVLEQKVYLTTSSPLYPNLYVFIVGHPGVGKTRTVHAAASFLREIPEFYLAPTSMSGASLVDALSEAKRIIVKYPPPALEYNSMTIVADELSAFMPKYDDDLIGNLTTFYDVIVPYGQRRRGKEIKIKIAKPQLSILSGTTPSNLLKFIPETAWDQGFTSRCIMIFSDERIISEDVFAQQVNSLPEEMVHDLKMVNGLEGGFEVTVDYKNAVNNWRKLGQPPVPIHPKLIHYNTRRLAHLFKLSIVSAVDRANALLLTKEDFNRALGWLMEAEQDMPEIFKAGSTAADSKAMDELVHFVTVADRGSGVPETAMFRRGRELVPAYSVERVLEVMIRAGMVKTTVVKGVRFYSVP